MRQVYLERRWETSKVGWMRREESVFGACSMGLEGVGHVVVQVGERRMVWGYCAVLRSPQLAP